MTSRTSAVRPGRVALAAAVALVAVAAAWFALGALPRIVSTAAAGASPVELVRGALDTGPSADDGLIADGQRVTAYDDVPAVTRMDASLLAAVRRATDDARADGIAVVVNSGWRSARLQEQLLSEAIASHGSREEAARWVATPETSAHVTGDAVDIGPWDAMSWLSQHGWRYGLCQTYANEPWHFELRADAPSGGCPEQFADPTDDPRLG